MGDWRIANMEKYTEAILLRICEKLQLTPSLYQQANDRYKTITDTLRKDEAFRNIDLSMYPQGSFRLKTTVKPLNGNEYDLDFVAELPIGTMMTPYDLYDHIARILQNDGVHNNMVELKKRCIRVNYANDFHMDIMPGKLINANTNEIVVPDKDLKTWYHHSNPIGFAKWFEEQAKTQIFFELSEQRRVLAQVEKVTEQEVAKQLEPLRRAVQLVKRYRDVYCDEHKTEPVRSIVICTLMGEIASFMGDTLQIIQSFCQHVNSLIVQNDYRPFEVKNPVVDEVLTEKWKEGTNFQDFVKMMSALSEDIISLRESSINSRINELIKKMFGEEVTNTAINEYASSLTKARLSGGLSVGPKGDLNINGSGVSVKKNTFFGSDNVKS